MNAERITCGCSFDCPGNCSMMATVMDGRIINLEGNKDHPMTRGLICSKGKSHLDRVYHPDRILNPKRKVNGKWMDISYEDAMDEISRKLLYYREEYGSESILLYTGGAYKGLSKTVDKMFFNYFGGATTSIGCLCSGAGKEAQRIDFGSNKTHHPEDILNARTIIIWGRNPADTNIHLLKKVVEAKKGGAKVYVIDPIGTNTAKIASKHIPIRPGSDGALAFGMAKYIIENNLMDREYIAKNVIGFEEYREYLESFHIDHIEKITGVDKEIIIELTRNYAVNSPSSIYLGYGVQRYRNGGNNIRAIDALGAITGNIGRKGGGVNYVNNVIARNVYSEVDRSKKLVSGKSTYIIGQFADYILNQDNTPVKCMFINKGNPLVQVGDVSKNIQAFNRVDFKVVIDLFMTDTAKYADLIIPATSILEEEDFIFSEMYSPYLNYSNRVIKPRNNILGEYDFFRILAKKMKLKGYPDMDRETFFKGAFKDMMKKYNVNYHSLREHPFTPNEEPIPWEDGYFDTPSGKYELYSRSAQGQGVSPIPIFIPIKESTEAYPLRLLTPHPKESIHSQHYLTKKDGPIAYLNQRTLAQQGFKDKQRVIVQSKYGEMEVCLSLNNDIGDGMIMIYEGWWHRSGSVNRLTSNEISDIGKQAAYYESFCRLIEIGK